MDVSEIDCLTGGWEGTLAGVTMDVDSTDVVDSLLTTGDFGNASITFSGEGGGECLGVRVSLGGEERSLCRRGDLDLDLDLDLDGSRLRTGDLESSRERR